MLYISGNGDAIKTDTGYESELSIYDSWVNGKDRFEIRTSGSTGKPKIIQLNREAILGSINMTKDYFKLTSDDLFLCNLNTDYIAGLMMILRAAELNGEIIVVKPSSNPIEAIHVQRYLLQNNKGNFFLAFVPMQFRNIIEKPENIHLLKLAKAILVGGAGIPEDLKKLIMQHQLPVFETYGMTETISHIAIKNLKKGEEHFTTLKGVEIEADNENCLKIKAPSTLNQWINTNDVVEILSKKTFKLRGRRDNIINSGGIKIQLEEVDRMISEKFPISNNYFSYGVEDNVLGEKLVLFVEGENIDFNGLVSKLPQYKKPKEVIYLSEFIRTPSGKIDKIKTSRLK